MAQQLTSAVVTHPRVRRCDAKDISGVREREAINGDKFEDRALSLRQFRERFEQRTRIALGVDPSGETFGGVIVEP
jgi:hypothetical protein